MNATVTLECWCGVTVTMRGPIPAAIAVLENHVPPDHAESPE